MQRTLVRWGLLRDGRIKGSDAENFDFSIKEKGSFFFPELLQSNFKKHEIPYT